MTLLDEVVKRGPEKVAHTQYRVNRPWVRPAKVKNPGPKDPALVCLRERFKV
jgi:hypothetical protein